MAKSKSPGLDTLHGPDVLEEEMALHRETAPGAFLGMEGAMEE